MLREQTCIITIYLVFFSTTVSISQDLKYALSHANSLFESEDYDLALLEYNRVLFFSEDSAASSCHLNIARCLFELGDIKEAEQHIQIAASSCSNDSLRTEIICLSAIHYIKSNNFYGALKVLDSICLETGEFLARKIKLIQGIAFYGINDLEAAFDAFSCCLPSDNHQQIYKLNKNRNELLKVNKTSPNILLFLSGVFPGSAQFILGNTKEGLVSTILCSGLATISIGSVFILSNNALFILTWPWFIRYYVGGIKKSHDMIQQKYNSKNALVYHDILNTISMSNNGLNLEEFQNLYTPGDNHDRSDQPKDTLETTLKSTNKVYQFYKRYISPQDIMDCIYYPSCSFYALTTIELNGLLGILDAIDRLTRCHLFGHSQHEIHSKTNLLYDPVKKFRNFPTAPSPYQNQD